MRRRPPTAYGRALGDDGGFLDAVFACGRDPIRY
jgi:hypothetical protein